MLQNKINPEISPIPLYGRQTQKYARNQEYDAQFICIWVRIAEYVPLPHSIRSQEAHYQDQDAADQQGPVTNLLDDTVCLEQESLHDELLQPAARPIRAGRRLARVRLVLVGELLVQFLSNRFYLVRDCRIH